MSCSLIDPMQIRSPLTNTTNVICEEELESSQIINAYRRDLGEKVSVFVEACLQGIDVVRIYQCLDTGYRFYVPLDLAGDGKFYEQLQQSSQQYYSLNLEHRLTEQFLGRHDLVLEIGCGSGLFMERLQQIGIKSIGLEFNEMAVLRARSQGLSVFREDIADHAKHHGEFYDVVCSFQVLEHIAEVKPFLQAALKTLKPGGKFIVGVPNNNPFLFQYDKYHTLNLPPHHVGLWNQQALKSLNKLFDLRLQKILVEPLLEQDYGHYLNLELHYWKNKPGWLAKLSQFFLFELKPSRLHYTFQKLRLKFAQGRNILVVYIKT